MFARIMKPLTRGRGRDVLLAASCLALLAAPAAAQDTDEDGTLPKTSDQSDPSQGLGTPGVVGIALDDLGDEVLDPAEARLVASDLDGTISVETGVEPADAMFVTTGQLDLHATDAAVSLQGAGEVVLDPGIGVTLEAAPESLGRLTLLVVHAADADLHALLSGAVAPVALVPAGDLASVDLGAFQNLVTAHASGLAGLHVTVVDLSFDLQVHLHVAAVRFAPEGAPIEFVTD